jgi:soluble lytic murein transglycosylase
MLSYYESIGEGTEARREASRLIKFHKQDAESLVHLARLCRRLALADYTIRCGRRLQELAAHVQADDVHPLLLTLIYPVGYLDLVVAEAGQYDDIDPFFVLGLMRQESWFRPDAMSGANARGLLQIIPPTGRHIAREMGDAGSFRPEILLEPKINIRYGIWYIRSLQRRYDGNLSIVASAYNAGEANADIWIARNDRHPEEEYVELINYSETRTYVKRTLSGYWIYRSLYRDLAANLFVG